MHPTFVRRFNSSMGNKLAGGLGELLGRGFRSYEKMSPMMQTVGGIAASSGLSELEHAGLEYAGLAPADPKASMAARLFTHGLNASLLGVRFGNPRLRRDTFAFRNPTTGLPVEGTFDTSKALGNASIKLVTVPLGMGTTNLLFATKDANKMMSTASTGVSIATEGVSNITESITGAKPGETPYEAAMRRTFMATYDPKNPPAPLTPGTTRSTDPTQVAKDTWNRFAATNPEIAANTQHYDGYSKSNFKEFVDAANLSVEKRNIGSQIEDLGKTVEMIQSSAKNIQGATSNVAGASEALAGIDSRFDQLGQQIRPVSDLARKIPKYLDSIPAGLATAAKYVGGAALAGGGLYAAYNLIRDKLNYNRVKAEREAKHRGNVPKLAIGLSISKIPQTPGVAGGDVDPKIQAGVLSVIADQYGSNDFKAVHPGADFNKDLGFDLYDRDEVATVAEGMFGVTIPYEDLQRIRNGADLTRAIMRQKSAPKLAALVEKFAWSGVDAFKARNTPDMVAQRQSSVNQSQAAQLSHRDAAASAAVARRKQEQLEAPKLTPNGMPVNRVSVDPGGNPANSMTVYDRNGKPVGTNRPVARPVDMGQYGTGPTYAGNPQLGAQIAGQVHGAEKPAVTPFKLSPLPAPKPIAAPPQSAPPSTSPIAVPAASPPAASPPPVVRPTMPTPPTPINLSEPVTSTGAPLYGAPAHAPPVASVKPPSPSTAFHDPFANLPPAAPSPTPNFDHTFDPSAGTEADAFGPLSAGGQDLLNMKPKQGPLVSGAPATPLGPLSTTPSSAGKWQVAGAPPAMPAPVILPGAPTLVPKTPSLGGGLSPFAKAETGNRASNVAGVNQTNAAIPHQPIVDIPDKGTTPLTASSHADSIMHGTKSAGWGSPGSWANATRGQKATRLLTAGTIGGVEGAFNYDPDHPMNAVVGGGLGLLSGLKFFDKSKMVRSMAAPLVAASGLIPRAGTAMLASAKNNQSSAGLSETLSGLSTPVIIGGGAITLAGLAALYQATRAAKRVGDGEPLVNATSNNNVYAGGSGGTDNPNMGGKVRVTLPTRHPGDNETQVELPLENIPMSGAIIDQIRRDTKRRLRAEGSSRTIRQGAPPTTMKTLMSI